MMYSIEIDIQDEGEATTFQGSRYGWLNWDTLVTEGTTLEELIDNAELFTQDQDGGSGPSAMLTDMPDSFIERYEKLFQDEMAMQDDKNSAKVI